MDFEALEVSSVTAEGNFATGGAGAYLPPAVAKLIVLLNNLNSFSARWVE